MFARASRILVAAFAVTTACVSSTAPKGFLPTPRQAQHDAFGGWIELRFVDVGVDRTMDGELIAVSNDSVWVLGSTSARSIPTTAVTEGRLTGYASGAGGVGAATVLGVLSTISNGWFLVFTTPMWVIGGSIAASRESRAPVREVGQLRWSALRPFARFPQGFPVGVQLSELRSKPPSRNDPD